MGAEEVLKRAYLPSLTLPLLLASAALTTVARADNLRTPRKLTVALSDELLGVLAPDDRDLYFVSNRQATTQIFHQDLDAPASTLLFDEAADVSAPRPSPDGKELAYLSFRDDAAGQLCVRALPRPDRTSERRCLDGEGAIAAIWRTPKQLVLLERGAGQGEGDLRLALVDVEGSRLTRRVLGDANLTGPTVSPDGKWIVYVPVARAGERIGPAFAAQAARTLVVRSLVGDALGAEQRVHVSLPGITGQPAFSPDGKWLYFTQFLDDTDQNDVLDADDHGVVFRVAWAGGASNPAGELAHAEPQQVTSGSWNCQYPAPSPSRVVMTCSKTGSLDLFSLPLDGVVPEGWPPEHVAAELEATRDRLSRLLLLRRLGELSTDGSVRAGVLLETVRLHLDVGEYVAALAHAEELASLPSPLAALVPSLKLLIAERQSLRAFDAGAAGQQVLDESAARYDQLLKAPPTESEAARVFRELVLSELADDLGDEANALTALGRANVSDDTPAFVVLARAQRIEKLHRELDQNDVLIAELGPLVNHPSLPPNEQLRLGGIYARSILRGRSDKDGQQALAKERAPLSPATARAFALDLEACVARIMKVTLSDGTACVNALYDAHPQLTRRRALVAAVVRRAEEQDTDDLEYAIAKRWAHDVPKDAPEQRRALRTYRHVAEDQGYESLHAGQLDDAAEEFAQVIAEAGTPEDVVAYIETRLRQGRSTEMAEQDVAQRFGADSGPLHLTRAYLGTHALHELRGPAFVAGVAVAARELALAEKTLGATCVIEALHGTQQHLVYLRGHEVRDAEEANTRYLLAIDLADSTRCRAVTLEQLGRLHEAVGNHRIAVGYLDERAQLPFFSVAVEMGHHLARARALGHAGRDAEAAKSAETAVAVADREPSLARFRPLVLDRAALHALTAADGATALRLYDRLAKLLVEPSYATTSRLAKTPAEVTRNRVVIELAEAAAALVAHAPDAALTHLDAFSAALADPVRRAAVLAWPDATPDDAALTYELLRLGLRAQAERALGRIDDAARDANARQKLLATREATLSLDDNLHALTLTETQLAELAIAHHSPTEAARLASSALARADELAKRSHTRLAEAELQALKFAVELHVLKGVPREAFGFDLESRLADAYDELTKNADPSKLTLRRKLAVYLTLMELDQ